MIGASVTGMGLICSAGADLPACMETIFKGGQAPQIPTRMGEDCASGFPVFQIQDSALACLPAGDDLSLSTAMAIRASKEALEQSGWSIKDLHKYRVGVALGTTVGASLNFLDFYKKYKSGRVASLTSVKKYIASNPAERVSREFGLSGPVLCLTNACTSGADAIGAALSWLEQDVCDLAIAGGCDELNEVAITGFARLMVASTAQCRPFDLNRKGLNLGEGAGVVLLEKPGLLRDGGSRCMGKVLAYGTQSDAYHLTAPQPEAVGLKKAVSVCLKKTGLKNSDATFINAHGTATKNNDLVEGTVLAEMFAGIPFLSTKGYTGHTLGAAGAIEAIFTLHSLAHGRLPASRGFENFDPSVGVKPITDNMIIQGDYALSFSLAFGGNNSVLLLSGTN
jgi:3-oxoacyl-(acyl-carrier-protein) synthase